MLSVTGEIYKPGKSDVQFEVATPLRRLRLRWFNQSFVSRPVLDCRAPTIDVPLNRWIQVGAVIDQWGNATLYQSGFKVTSSCPFTRGGGGPKGIGEVLRSGAWLGRSANFGGQFFGAFAQFDSFDRALSDGEIASLAATPPRNIGVRNISVLVLGALSFSVVSQTSVVSVTPGMETTLGLNLKPLIYSPVWYLTSEMQFYKIVWDTVVGSAQVSTLAFPPLAPNSAGTKYFSILWTSLVPFVTVDFESTDIAHFSWPRNFTVWNTLPAALIATGLFVLDSAAPSFNAKWLPAVSTSPTADGIVMFNHSTILQSLDLHNTADCGTPTAPSGPMMPAAVASAGFSALAWVKVQAATAADAAAVPVVRWFSWRASFSTNDDGIFIEFDQSTGRVAFGAALAGNGVGCRCQADRPSAYDIWMPVTISWQTNGLMRLVVGEPKAGYQLKQCTCIDTGGGVYPSPATTRDICRLGRQTGSATATPPPANVAPWLLASFSYFDYALTDVKQKVLVYHAPSNIAPSPWIRTPAALPTQSFLNVVFTVTLEPASYSTLSGNVTITPQLNGAGTVTPTSILFHDRSPRTFTFVTPFRDTLWTVDFDLSGDSFFFARPESFTIDCAVGLFTVTDLPNNMLPTQTVTVSYLPAAFIEYDLGLKYLINGVDAVTDPTAQVQVSPLSFTWGAQDNTVRYLSLSTNAFYGTALSFLLSTATFGTDGFNFRAPALVNISISNTAHVLLKNVPTMMYAEAILLVPIQIKPDTVPPNGFSMTLTSSLGASVLGGLNSIVFPAGVVQTTLLTLDTNGLSFVGTSTTLVISFGVSGPDSSIFVQPYDLSIFIQRPQPINMLAPAALPAFMYANQQLTFTFIPSEAPVINVTLIVTLTRTTLYPPPLPPALPLNTTTLIFRQNPLTSKTFTIAAPASPVDTTLEISYAFGGHDLQHFILPAPVSLQVYAQSQITIVNAASIPTRIRVNTTLTIQVTVSKPPLVPGTTDLLYLLSDCGNAVITPAFVSLDAATYNTVQTFTFVAPSNFAEQCAIKLEVTGANSGYYAPHLPTPVFDVVGFFVLLSVPPPVLFLGQFSPTQELEARGISPLPDIILVCSSTGTGALYAPPTIIFKPEQPKAPFTYSAPFDLPGGVTAVTLSFLLEGGIDADKMDMPGQLTTRSRQLS